MSEDKSVEAGTGKTEEAVNSAGAASDETAGPTAAAATATVTSETGSADTSAVGDREPSQKATPGGERSEGDPVGFEKETAGPGAPWTRGARPLIIALVAATVLLLGAVGVAGYLYVQEADKSATLAAYEEARQAACRYAPVLADYDAQNLDPYFAAVAAGATGDWKKEFETTTAELREALVAGQVVSTAGDIQCAVKSADESSAEAVVVIGQTISSLGTQGRPAPGQLSMVMRMQKIDGNWLVDQMITPLAPTTAP
ncbi:hypothetical protein [Nocardia sp. NPDC003963]